MAGEDKAGRPQISEKEGQGWKEKQNDHPLCYVSFWS